MTPTSIAKAPDTQAPRTGQRLAGGLCLVLAALLGACATQPKGYDYTAFKASRPASLLVLPPVSDSNEVNAPYGVLAQATAPLAEAGYYVLPVTLVNQTFRENGLTMPADIQAVSTTKLREIFGADAAVYLRVKRYGSTYNVISSAAVVELEARIVDLRNGTELWHGSAQASSAEGQNNNNQAGLIGLLVQAIVTQVLNSTTDASYKVAGIASQRLLAPNPVNGVLPGPRAKAVAGQ